MTNYVFLSYSRQDGGEAADYLERAVPDKCSDVHEVWRDIRKLDPAQNFAPQIAKAIENCRAILICITKDSQRDTSYVWNEIGHAIAHKKRIIPLRFEDIPPHIDLNHLSYINFLKYPDEAKLAELCRAINSDVLSTQERAWENDPYRPYLERLAAWASGFLGSIVIREIDLLAKDSPGKVKGKSIELGLFEARLPDYARKGLRVDHSPKAINNFSEGFEAYGGRVLLLGEPGAGKTVTLLNELIRAILRRKTDPKAPVPFFEFITSWNAEKQAPFAEWLCQRYAPDLNPAMVESAIKSGQAVLFLDGLDELGGEREEEKEVDDIGEDGKPKKDKDDKPQKKKVRVSYDPRQRFVAALSNYPAPTQALVTCRIKDYQEIEQQVPLNGAVQLLPLNDEQIAEYLKDLPELYQAVQADPNLKEMLRVPLLMSLFAFAFRDDLKPEERQELQDLGAAGDEELRDRILLLYLERRYQWEAAKGLPMPFSYENWLGMLQVVAYRGVDTFADKYWYGDGYDKVSELNILTRKNLMIDLGREVVYQFLEFSQKLNLLVPIDSRTYRFQHMLLLRVLALPYAPKQLSRVDVELRQKACWVLMELRSKQSVEPLIVALGDEDSSVRNSAAEALGSIGDSRAVGPLIAVLGDRAVGWSAAKALVKIALPAVESLITALEDEDREVCRLAAEILGRIGDSRAVEPLIAVLGDTDIGRSAAEALDQLNWKPQDVSLRVKYEIAKQNWDALVKIGAPAVESLIVFLDDKVGFPQIMILKTIGEYSSGYLSLVSKRPCDYAAEALEAINTPESRAALAAWLAAGNEIIRE
jgi:HEAT repeat protein/nucleoside 2-deoxyribosyltransferase